MEEKQCSVCGEIKPLDQFYKQNKYSESKGHWVYFNPECKECTSKRSSEWQYSHYERHKKNVARYDATPKKKLKTREYARKQRERGDQKKWQQSNKDKIKEYNYYRSKHKNHDITQDEWEICKEFFNYECAYCGIKEEKAKKDQGQFLHKEHVDHEGANDISNCVPACRSCNSKKWIFTLDDWYNENNPIFSSVRYEKIMKWLSYFKDININ